MRDPHIDSVANSHISRIKEQKAAMKEFRDMLEKEKESKGGNWHRGYFTRFKVENGIGHYEIYDSNMHFLGSADNGALDEFLNELEPEVA